MSSARGLLLLVESIRSVAKPKGGAVRERCEPGALGKDTPLTADRRNASFYYRNIMVGDASFQPGWAPGGCGHVGGYG